MLEPKGDRTGGNPGQIAFVIGAVVMQMSAAANHQHPFFIKIIRQAIQERSYQLADTHLPDGPDHILGNRNVFAGGLRSPGCQGEILHAARPGHKSLAVQAPVPPLPEHGIVSESGYPGLKRADEILVF